MLHKALHGALHKLARHAELRLDAEQWGSAHVASDDDPGHQTGLRAPIGERKRSPRRLAGTQLPKGEKARRDLER
jgi:hypothetical protein